MMTHLGLFNIKQMRTPVTIAGFNLIESMIALALLATIMLSIVLFNTNSTRKKDAKILTSQTEAFAVAYAKYMKHEYEGINSKTGTVPYVLSPKVLTQVGAWPIDLHTTNMYKQTPCVVIIKNRSTNNLEAIMYYVGGIEDAKNRQIDTMRDAAVQLGDKGGILKNGSILGNSGWTIAAGSAFLSSANQCGGSIANNSIAINMDLLQNWNQNIQQTHSLLRGLDKTPGVLSLPGHVKNSNTLKENLYLAANTGIVLETAKDGDPRRQTSTKLSIAYNGRGSGAATLGLGNATATIIGDTFQPDLFLRAGEPCNAEEEGKTVADAGVNSIANKFLSRSTIVCTQNEMLCKNKYCYLPSLPNKIVFKNSVSGIQDASGQFICPQAVPFAEDIKTAILGGAGVYAIVNDGGASTLNTIVATLKKRRSSVTKPINCPTSGCRDGIRTDYASGIIDGQGQLISVDLATVTGNPVGITTGRVDNADYQIIQGAIGKYTTPIGYKLTNSSTKSCDQICSNLRDILGNTWQVLGTQRKSRIGFEVEIYNQHLGCGCERTYFKGSNPDNYTGIAATIGSGKAIITSVTCSNMPLYYYNN